MKETSRPSLTAKREQACSRTRESLLTFRSLSKQKLLNNSSEELALFRTPSLNLLEQKHFRRCSRNAPKIRKHSWWAMWAISDLEAPRIVGRACSRSLKLLVIRDAATCMNYFASSTERSCKRRYSALTNPRLRVLIYLTSSLLLRNPFQSFRERLKWGKIHAFKNEKSAKEAPRGLHRKDPLAPKQ